MMSVRVVGIAKHGLRGAGSAYGWRTVGRALSWLVDQPSVFKRRPACNWACSSLRWWSNSPAYRRSLHRWSKPAQTGGEGGGRG